MVLATVPPPGDAGLPAEVLGNPERKGLKILLVEDNPDTLRAISRLLRLQGFVVQEASNVREAFEAATMKPIDLLVSDIGLPDGSGLDVMRYARDRFGLRGIAFSGFGTEDDIKESREAGFEHHLIKPVRIGSKLTALKRTA